jgi:hypothetical protein
MVLAGTPLIDNKDNTTKTAEAAGNGTPSTRLNNVFKAVMSTIHYPVCIILKVL